MTFFNILMLFGLFATLIPIILHLLNRRHAKNLDWGAMQFLLGSLVSRKRRILIEEMMLLALRCLLLALLVLAVARPIVAEHPDPRRARLPLRRPGEAHRPLLGNARLPAHRVRAGRHLPVHGRGSLRAALLALRRSRRAAALGHRCAHRARGRVRLRLPARLLSLRRLPGPRRGTGAVPPAGGVGGAGAPGGAGGADIVCSQGEAGNGADGQQGGTGGFGVGGSSTGLYCENTTPSLQGTVTFGFGTVGMHGTGAVAVVSIGCP